MATETLNGEHATDNAEVNRIQAILDAEAKAKEEAAKEVKDVPADEFLTGLVHKLGSKGRIRGTLIVKGVEMTKSTLRAGMVSYTDDNFLDAAKSSGIDITKDIDVTFHGVFRAKKHTDRVVGDNAIELIAELKEANEALEAK